MAFAGESRGYPESMQGTGDGGAVKATGVLVALIIAFIMVRVNIARSRILPPMKALKFKSPSVVHDGQMQLCT